MQKLDRLGWAAGFSFSAFGTRVGVRTNKPELLDELKRRLPLGWKPSAQPLVESLFSFKAGKAGAQSSKLRQFHLVYGNFTQLARTLDLTEALDTFETGLQLHVAETARRRVFVHAGVVAWQGRAIVIPGRSHSGKSTLVRALVKAGAVYYSDEYAVLDAQGRVHPYPLPLGVRRNPLTKQEKHPIESFGGVPGVKPLPVGLVLVTGYKTGARWQPRQLPAGQGLLALLANTVSAHYNPGAALQALQQVVSQARCLKSARGEAGELAERLFAAMSD